MKYQKHSPPLLISSLIHEVYPFLRLGYQIGQQCIQPFLLKSRERSIGEHFFDAIGSQSHLSRTIL